MYATNMVVSVIAIIASQLYMCKEEGYDEKIRQYVNNGGTFLTTYFSGYVEEIDALPAAYRTKVYRGEIKFLIGNVRVES